LFFAYCLPQTACPAAYLTRTRITANYFVFNNIVESLKTAFLLHLFSATFRLRSHALGPPFLPQVDQGKAFKPFDFSDLMILKNHDEYR